MVKPLSERGSRSWLGVQFVNFLYLGGVSSGQLWKAGFHGEPQEKLKLVFAGLSWLSTEARWFCTWQSPNKLKWEVQSSPLLDSEASSSWLAGGRMALFASRQLPAGSCLLLALFGALCMLSYEFLALCHMGTSMLFQDITGGIVNCLQGPQK